MDGTTGTYSIDGQSPVSFALNGLAAQDTGVQYNRVFFKTPELEAKTHIIEVSYQGDTTKTPLSLYILQIQNGASATSTTSVQVSSTASSVTSSARSTTGTATLNSSSQNNPQTASSTSSSTTSVQNTQSNPSTQSAQLSRTFGSSSSTTGTSSTTVPTGSSAFAGDISNKDRTPAFLGGILGGFALLLLIGILALFLRRRRQRSHNQIAGVSHNLGPQPSETIRPFLLSPVLPSSNQTSPASYGTLNDSNHTGASSTRPEVPLSPVRHESHPIISTKKYESRQDIHPSAQPITSPQLASNPELSNQSALSPGFDPLPGTKHAPASSSSRTELSSPYAGGGDRDQMDSLHRDVDSGMRFGAGESTTLPPRYTLL
ncbi:hypothetical protein CPC08DRAFT_66805 [Agrocybe pediades]|nr:hypothetical protein CPC08DRAFT_66805 [Agrocybe pediades]